MNRKEMLTPLRPATPYISLDDPNAQDYFTKERVQKHLRRAGLLNKNGDILTEAEYESKQTDIAIGRENRRKIDDAITEVLNDMAKEHWGQMRDYMKKTEKKLKVDFRRIEKQYRRRIQPINVRLRHRGAAFELESIQPITDHSSTAVVNLSDSSVSAFPLISSDRPPSRPQSSHNQRSNESNDIRQQLKGIKNKLADFERRLNRNPKNEDSPRQIESLLDTSQQNQNALRQQDESLNKRHDEEKQRIDELDQRLKSLTDQIRPNVLDKQKIEHSIKSSTTIGDLRQSIVNLEISIRNLSAEHKQQLIVKSIKKNEDKTNGKLVDDLKEKIKQMDSELIQLSKRLDGIPTPITHYDINQLIQNQIQNFHQTLKGNNKRGNLAPETNNQTNKLEIQSNKVYLTRSEAEELINQAISHQQPIPQRETHLEQRLNDLERRFNTISLPPNLNVIEQRIIQLENRPSNVQNHPTSTVQDQKQQYGELIESLQKQIDELNRRILDPPVIEEIKQNTQQAIDQLSNKTDEQLRNLYNEMTGLLDKKPNQQTDNRRLSENEASTINNQIKALQQSVDDNKRVMDKIQEKLADLNRRLNRKPKTTTSQMLDEPKSNENPLTLKELQAVMPFIELLPTFDMFNENEWN